MSKPKTHQSRQPVYMTLTPQEVPTPVSRALRVRRAVLRFTAVVVTAIVVDVFVSFVISSVILGAPTAIQNVARSYEAVFGQDDAPELLEGTTVVDDCVLPDDGQDYVIPTDCLDFMATTPEVTPSPTPLAPTVPPQAHPPVTDIVCAVIADSTDIGYLTLPYVSVTAQGAGNVGYLTGLTLGATVTITYRTVTHFYPMPDGTQTSYEVNELTGLTVESWDVDKNSFNRCPQGK